MSWVLGTTWRGGGVGRMEGWRVRLGRTGQVSASGVTSCHHRPGNINLYSRDQTLPLLSSCCIQVCRYKRVYILPSLHYLIINLTLANYTQREDDEVENQIIRVTVLRSHLHLPQTWKPLPLM